jgi:ParB-like nuclease domain
VLKAGTVVVTKQLRRGQLLGFLREAAAEAVKKTPKYAQIATSMHELGIIEPPVVARDQTHPGKYLLLDGHSRIEVLKDKGQTEVTCLISTDDEAFTYNKRVNRLAMIQEHRMPQGGRARRSRGSYCQSAERRRCEHCPEAKTARGDLPRSC